MWAKEKTMNAILMFCIASVGAGELIASPPALRPIVEAEEDVYTSTPANNGAGPTWCHGSTCLVRITVAEGVPDMVAKVLIAIADVDAVVKKRSALDDHARQNTT